MVRKLTGKPVGRPAKGSYTGKKTALTTRITEDLKSRLEDDADKTGNSLSQVIELRLDESLNGYGFKSADFGSVETFAMCRLIGLFMKNYRALEGDDMWAHDFVHTNLVSAINVIVEAFGPTGIIPKPDTNEQPDDPPEDQGDRRGRLFLINFYKSRPRTGYDKRTATGDEKAFAEIWTSLGSLTNQLESKLKANGLI